MVAIKKEPFERIRSILERRKLFEAVISEGGSIVCKGSDDSLFQFKPLEIIDDQSCLGTAVAIEKLPQKDVEVVGNFAVDTDKYFIRADLRIRNNVIRLPVACDVFKLQRRQSLRVSLPPSFPIYLNVREVAGKPLLVEAKVADLSAGGVKIYFPEEKINLKTGDIIKAVIHPPSGRTCDIVGEVKHIISTTMNNELVPHYGVEFIQLTGVDRNRLLALSMDIQQRVIKGI